MISEESLAPVSAADQADYPSRRTAWWTVTVLFLAAIVSIIDRGIINIVVDPVRHDLGLADFQIGLLQGLAFGLFYATVGIPLGLIADRVSRRLLVTVGVLVWSLATIGGGLAATFGELFASRLLVGLGEAALGPAAVSLIADLFPPHRRGKPLSLFLTGQAVANGMAISLTSFIMAAAANGRFAGIPLLQDAAPWRVAFIGCGTLGLAVVAMMLMTREPPRRGIQGTADPTSLADKLSFLKRNGAVLVPLYLGFALCFMAAYAAAAWSPAMLTRAFGLGPAMIGAWLGPFSMTFSFLGPLVGGLMIDHFARRSLAMAKFGILMVGPLLAIPSALAVFVPGPVFAMFLVASSSAIFAVLGATTFATLQSIVPPTMRGGAIALSGLVNTIIGATLGPLLVATLTDRLFRNPTMVGYSIAIVVVPALLGGSALFVLARRGMVRQRRAGGEAAAMLLASEGQRVGSYR
ncbi:MFS transporter [Nitrospirillum sp. BR 11752]|uniref:MFS transporter n=1 Tax=Nitrospirillum sp. BR 11752 TaxID=3104293 RepID=UPI002EA31288|nr:MFS transporter [Nitrospirillum sp. BR 11752]